MKEKYCIEYILNLTSLKNLWGYLATPEGLSQWFADDVVVKNREYIFKWKREEQAAEVLSVTPEKKIRYRWLDEEEDGCYFEFRIKALELTGDILLEVTDFAEPDEKNEAIKLWNMQIESLKRKLGI